jgi:hypothetical protein
MLFPLAAEKVVARTAPAAYNHRQPQRLKEKLSEKHGGEAVNWHHCDAPS